MTFPPSLWGKILFLTIASENPSMARLFRTATNVVSLLIPIPIVLITIAISCLFSAANAWKNTTVVVPKIVSISIHYRWRKKSNSRSCGNRSMRGVKFLINWTIGNKNTKRLSLSNYYLPRKCRRIPIFYLSYPLNPPFGG